MTDETKIKVLLVDSDSANRASCRELLAADRRHVYDFDESSSVEEGLRSFALEGHDCIIVDSGLESGRGVEFVRRLTGLHGPMAVPVVFLIPVSRQDLGITAIKAGANELVIREALSQAALVKAVTNAVTQIVFEREMEKHQSEMETKNRDLNAFSAVVAHDLKSPLFKVQLLADTINALYAAKLDDKGREYLSKMKASLARMQSLIDSLLAYAVATKTAGDFQKIDLKKIVEDSLADLDANIQGRNAHVVVGEMGIVRGDPVLLRQLVQNLVANSLKYSRKDVPSEIRIWCENRESEDGSQCFLNVKDNGIGFATTDVERIFQPFQRLHQGDAYGGIGMGLATCRKIAELHGGTIATASRPGEGATFTVGLRRD